MGELLRNIMKTRHVHLYNERIFGRWSKDISRFRLVNGRVVKFLFDNAKLFVNYSFCLDEVLVFRILFRSQFIDNEAKPTEPLSAIIRKL